ncbi:MAG: hypothetical protein ABEI06_09235 [Halobacteriaceae archaeon]
MGYVLTCTFCDFREVVEGMEKALEKADEHESQSVAHIVEIEKVEDTDQITESQS